MARNIMASPRFSPSEAREPSLPDETTRATPTIASNEPQTPPRVSGWPSMKTARASTSMGVSEPMMPMCVAVV